MMEPTEEQRRSSAKVADASAAIMAGFFKKTAFSERGFSEHTISVLMAHGMDLPERLLFMTEEQIRQIPGAGKAVIAQIKSYRARFLGEGK
jgi:hypothetical protein